MTAERRAALPGTPVSGADLADVALTWPSVRTATAPGIISDFVRDEVTAPDGHVLTREYLTHPGAVAVIALDDDDRVAVVTQYRHPAGFRFLEPPAGLLDVIDEDPLLAARRELAEEAELAASDWRVLVDVFTSPGCNQESIRIFLARDLAPVDRPDGFVLHGEEAHMELRWAPLPELVDAIYAGRVQNPTMVFGTLALHAARLEGRLDRLRTPEAAWPARAVKAEADARGSGAVTL